MITKFYLFEGKGNPKYQEIDGIEFKKLLEENCKNFSLDNDQLYRGDDLGMIALHNYLIY